MVDEEVIISSDELKLAPRPSFIHVIGPSQSGKTETVIKLLLNEKKTLCRPVGKVYYFYEFYQDAYNKLKNYFGSRIEFRHPFQGAHFFDEVESGQTERPIWVILDDQDRKLFNNLEMRDVICAHLHHKNINLVIMSHSFVSERKCYREIRNLANYYIIFDNFKFRNNIKLLSSELFDDSGFLRAALSDLNECLIRENGGNSMYSIPLLLDLRPGIRDILRARTLLFGIKAPQEEVYIFAPRRTT